MRPQQSWRSEKSKKRGRKKSSPLMRKIKKQLKEGDIVKNIFLLAIAAFLLGTIVFLALFAWYSKDLPDPSELIDREVAQSTKIYDRTGEHLLYEIAGDEKRTLVSYEDLPEDLINATITAEDRKFYSHSGVDPLGLLRAFTIGIIRSGRIEGTSTITQQLVKNAILTNERKLRRKIKEVILSLALERRYTKEEILQLYFNEIAYGSTNYGVESAAQAYFDSSVSDITLAQAATLAALPQQPSTFLNNPEKLKERRDWILTSMAELGYASESEVESALNEDTTVTLDITNIDAPHFVLWVKEQLEETYEERTVEQGGLTVITSIDHDMQKMAEDAIVANKLERGETYDFNNSGLVAMDPNTGEILAMAGSADYHDDEIDGQVNVTLQPLQPGSSIKPIIYTAGFEAGYTPNTLFWDVETTFPSSTGPYEPKNYDLSENGPVSIRKALQGSLNIPAVKMLYMLGVENGLNFAERLGYSTFEDRSDFGLAIVLGGAEVKLLDHTAAFATFASEGLYREPVSILKVTDPNGEVLEEWEADEGERVLEENIARMTSNVLSDDGARAYAFGLNSLLTLSGRPVAAKTGTTNNSKDAWTIGYTPSLVAGVWTGNTDGSLMASGAGGSSVAAPIWNEFMRNALEETEVEYFTAPEIPQTGKAMLDGVIPEETITIDTASGKLATERTPERFQETKTCGEYHTILTYVDRNDPLGDAPSDPSKADSAYDEWEGAIQTFLQKENEEVEEGDAPLEVCEIPTEFDDLHVAENEPRVKINSPQKNDDVGRSFTVEFIANANRGISRVEFLINDVVIDIATSTSDHTLNLPSWVEKGSHTLTIAAYDDIDNRGQAGVRINVSQSGDDVGGNVTMTNPFNGQVIEKTPENSSYPIAVEANLGASAESITIMAKNLWTGQTTIIYESSSVNSITSATWNLGDPAQYSLSARIQTDEGTIDSSPVIVTVTEEMQEILVDELTDAVVSEEEIL